MTKLDKQNISHLFFESARAFPDTIALVEGDRLLTFSELHDAVLKTASYFKKMGIKKGDRVLVFIPMSVDLYRIVLALFYIGAVAVFLDEWVNKSRMELCCKIAGCKGFVGIGKARVLRWFSSELRKIPVVLSKNKMDRLVDATDQDPVNPDDSALITFTTGSTGTPKAANRTHRFLKEQFDALREKIKPKSGDVDMSLLPIVLLINLGVGATSIIAKFSSRKPSTFRPEIICEQIKRYGVNRITASPYFISKLSDYLLQSQIQLPGIRQVFTGGAPVFPDEAALYTNAFKACDIQIVFGSTEAEPISSLQAQRLAARPLLENGLPVGKPDPRAEVKIIPITDQPIPACKESELNFCKNGEVGEIIVAGPHVLNNYLNNAEAILRNKIYVGNKVFHRTGDSGFLDEQGDLYLTGRCSGLFKRNQAMVYPFLYEYKLKSLEGLRCGTVLKHNNKMCVVIEVEKKADKTKIENQVFQLDVPPDQVLFMKTMPKDLRHHSKIDYDKLKKILNH